MSEKKIMSSDEDLGTESFTESSGLNILRADNDLFKDDENVRYKVINVRRVKLPKKGEDWEILEDNKVVLTLKGTRFTNSEKDFLRSVNGISFLMNGYKAGMKSVLKFKKEMKKLKI